MLQIFVWVLAHHLSCSRKEGVVLSVTLLDYQPTLLDYYFAKEQYWNTKLRY